MGCVWTLKVENSTLKVTLDLLGGGYPFLIFLAPQAVLAGRGYDLISLAEALLAFWIAGIWIRAISRGKSPMSLDGGFSGFWLGTRHIRPRSRQLLDRLAC